MIANLLKTFYKKKFKILIQNIFLLVDKAILSIFYIYIEYIKGETNFIHDFLTRKFLQNRSWCLPNLNPETGKFPQTKSESLKSQNPTKLFASTISSTKPIKSWYEVVIKEEEKECSFQIQHWVESLSNSLELLLALQAINQKSSQEERSSHVGKSSKPISKIKAGSSS